MIKKQQTFINNLDPSRTTINLSYFLSGLPIVTAVPYNNPKKFIPDVIPPISSVPGSKNTPALPVVRYGPGKTQTNLPVNKKKP